MSAQAEFVAPTIRTMLPADLDSVTAIEARSYIYPWSRGIFSDCLMADYFSIVVEIGGAVAGYSIVSVAAAEAHILNLCIDVDRQRQGLGNLLLQEALIYARQQHVQRMFLEVRPSNDVAIRLYEQSGFNRLGHRPGYYQAANGREDALVLAIQLGDEL